MKRFIRLKDNKIYEIAKDYRAVNGSGYVVAPERKYYLDKKKFIDIVAESDNILDLIQERDLVKFIAEGSYYFVCSTNKEMVCDYLYNYRFKEYITEIYTKQGNNYILVARKNDKGEWEIL